MKENSVNRGSKEGIKQRILKISIILIILNVFVSACTTQRQQINVSSFKTWQDVIVAGENKEVSILMWGGNESINQYMDQYVAPKIKELYGIKLVRVPMNASEYLTKLINEKKSGMTSGTADLLWINAENFLTAKMGGLLSEPFTALLPNLSQYYDNNASDLNYDSGILIDGYEAIWGRAQLVFTYDSETTIPPKTYAELLTWAKENPGKFTYPKLPDDFVGTAFVRNAYYELTGMKIDFQSEISEEDFREISRPVMKYFEELNPYLWNHGESYPATQAQLDELFKNGEIDFTMGFEIGKTAGLVSSGVYAPTVSTFVFDSGTIGNSHYLAIPFNAPQQAAALLVIDFLQSPEAQIEKMKPEVWGDMAAFDITRLNESQLREFSKVDYSLGNLRFETLSTHRLPEMKSDYIDWIKTIWLEHMSNQ